MIGRTLSHYEVLDELSRGGMGIVYRARDTKLNREVALKVLPSELVADEGRRRRFIQEAQAAAALKHPHIGVIYGIDEVEGVVFMALELIEGEKLGDLLKRDRLSVARILDLAVEMAEGLASAHAKNIVHRDLKPGNVMVTEEGHAKIIDFGLAKLFEPLGERDTEGETAVRKETDPGVVMGTVSYMSPEQARGRKVDHRSDIFSFGILLYEMLSGQLPFQGASGVETLNAILKEPPRSLSFADGSTGDLQKGELERILRKCLAKDPDERYQTMKDLVVDLKAARRASDSDISVTLAPTASSPSRRRSLFLGAAIAAVVLLLGAALFLLRRGASSETESAGVPTTTKPSVAILFFDNQSGDPDLDWLRTALTDMLVTDMSQSPNVDVLSTDRLYQVMEDLNRLDERITSFTVVQELAQRANVERVVLGSFVKAGDTIRINVRVQDAASGTILTSEQVEGVGEASIFPMVDDLNKRIKLSFDIPETADVGFDRGLSEVTTSSPEAYRHYAEGLKLHFEGRYRDAIPHFERAVDIDPDFAIALARLGIVHGNLGHTRESELYTARAFEKADRLPGRERYYIEGNYYSRHAETLPKAMAAYEKTLELDPGHVAARNNLALAFLGLGRIDEGIEHYEHLRAEGFTFPAAYLGLSAGHLARGEPEEAREVIEGFVRDHPDIADGHRNLARILAVLGQLDEAEKALEEYRGLTGGTPGFWNERWSLSTLEEKWTEADAAARQNGNSEDPTLRAGALRRQAVTDLYQGRLQAALDRLDAEVRAAGDERRSADARIYRGGVLLAANEPARALADAELARRAARGDLEEYGGLYESALAHALLEQWEEATSAADLFQERTAPLSSPRMKVRHRYLLGQLALLRGETSRAIEELERAASGLPARGAGPEGGLHVRVWFSLASAHLAAGNRTEALEWFQRIAESGWEHVYGPIPYVRSFYFLGKIYESQGETEKARENFQRFVDFWKDGDLDRERVAEARSKL